MKRKLSSLKPNECIHIRTQKEARKIFKQLRKIFPEDSCDMWESVFNISLITLPFFCFVTDTGYQISKYEKKTQPNKIPASDFIKPKSKLKKRVKALLVETNTEDELYEKIISLWKINHDAELTELPEKWCVEITDESFYDLFRWLDPACIPTKNKTFGGFVSSGKYWINAEDYGSTEGVKISFADFKRLVLGGEKTGWFKHSNDAGDYLFTYKDPENTNYVYGFFRGAWTYESWTWGSGVFCEPASEEEVSVALIAEAEKRGHNTTCAVYEMWNNQLYVNIEGFGKAILFENGRWSEVKKEEQEIDWSKPGQYVSTDDEGLILMTLEGDSIGDNTFSAVVIQDNRNNYCHYDAGNKSDIWLKSNFKLHTEPITINPV